MTHSDASPVTARHRLKSATAERHNALDRGFAALNLENRNDYRHFLKTQAAVLAPLEDWLKRHEIAQVLPDWAQRERSAAVQADLAGLDSAALPQPIHLPAPSPAALLGVGYVLEGSRLGARYLVRTVAGSPDPVVRDNTRFLRHGAGQNLWPSFLSALESRVTSHDDLRDAMFGAQQTFDLFLDAQRQSASAPVGA